MTGLTGAGSTTKGAPYSHVSKSGRRRQEPLWAKLPAVHSLQMMLQLEANHAASAMRATPWRSISPTGQTLTSR